MTENIASNPTPEPMENSHPNHAHRQEADSSPVNSAAEGWETVSFPGQLPIAEPLRSGDDQSALTANEMAAKPSDQQPDNTHELLQLVQDLNQCNDVLLGRVSELEEALEKSQAALQAEVERNQVGGDGVVVLTPDQPPEYVQRRMANLLSELEVANDGLRRTTIHNEALQAELETSQQRVAQLERECTLLQQRFSEKNTAFHRAEDSCRDLKARLYRQQRYTLQFKVALEKCLTMSSDTENNHASVSGRSHAPAATATQPVSMPKTPQIQPWSMQKQDVEPDPALDHLLRNLKAAGQGPKGTGLLTPDSRMQDRLGQTKPNLDQASDPEAESRLWHDLERVIETPAEMLPQHREGAAHARVADAMEPAPVNSVAQELSAEQEVGFTEPSPWGVPLTPSDSNSVPPDTELGSPAAAPQPDLAAATGAEETTVPPAYTHDESLSSQSNPSPAAGLPPYLKNSGQASPSPLVYPLRPQKKLTSLAAVQLPSFGKSVRR
jgi:hypothetical protein